MGISGFPVSTDIFAVVDLYGKAKTISIVSGNASQTDNLRNESRLSSYIEGKLLT